MSNAAFDYLYGVLWEGGEEYEDDDGGFSEAQFIRILNAGLSLAWDQGYRYGNDDAQVGQDTTVANPFARPDRRRG